MSSSLLSFLRGGAVGAVKSGLVLFVGLVGVGTKPPRDKPSKLLKRGELLVPLSLA